MSQWESDPNATHGVPVRAAQYVRMSIEHQKCSTENQADIIQAYAEARGFEIVRTYADQGKSGLRIDGRDALKQLLADVKAGRADYKELLDEDPDTARLRVGPRSALRKLDVQATRMAVHDLPGVLLDAPSRRSRRFADSRP